MKRLWLITAVGALVMAQRPGIRTNSLGIEMVRIEPGSFEMGVDSVPLPKDLLTGAQGVVYGRTSDQGDYDEAPVHRVTISKPFWIGVTEITIEQFRRWRPDYRGNPYYAPYASGVNWTDAMAFCKWLGAKEGRTGALVALSDDDGQTWKTRQLPDIVTVGYTTATQAPNGVIHIVTSKNAPPLHIELNEAWVIEGGPAAAPDTEVQDVRSYKESWPGGGLKAAWSGGFSRSGGYLLEGRQVFYYPSGRKQWEATFHAGRRTGTETWWNEAGRKVSERTYAGDGAWTWRLFDDIGRIQAESRWRVKDLLEANPGGALARSPAAGPMLFVYFREPADMGVFYALSDDGYHWRPLNGDKPWIGIEHAGELIRDPFITRGPDRQFHMVWTWGWRGQSIGYAHSPDLVHWSEQREIPLMAGTPGTRNTWAPEIYWNKARSQWLVIWSSTVEGLHEGNRIYSALTADFRTFTRPEIFFDPGYMVIDATILQTRGRYYLVFKDERVSPLHKAIRIAQGDSLEGPWKNICDEFTESWSEGPSAADVGGEYIVYYDHYRDPKRYEAVRSAGLVHWSSATGQMQFPAGCKHGSFLKISPEEKDRLERARP